jgi:hypothetical protein
MATRALLTLAVHEFGESSQNFLANVGESRKTVWGMSASLASPRKTVWRMLAGLASIASMRVLVKVHMIRYVVLLP